MVHPNLRIISFSFAGGSKYSFPEFSNYVPEFCVIEYPGRGVRINEKLCIEIDLLIEDLLKKIKDEINTTDEYIIYGHSMGALVGYLICYKIEELGLKKPLKLVVSGNKAPSLQRKEKLSHLPDNLFWEEIVKFGGIPEELLEQPELMKFYIPILRADFSALENYNHNKTKKLNIPIDVFYGTDEDISVREIMEWENESTEKVTVKQLEGNHFFINDNEAFFIKYFNSLINNFIYK